MKKIIIFGHGGQAKVVLDCIKLIKDYKVIGFISDKNYSFSFSKQIKYLGSMKDLNTIIKKYNSKNLFGIIGIGDNIKRKKNLDFFLKNLDSSKYRVNFDTKGSCNYAFPLVLKEPKAKNWIKLSYTMNKKKIEFRKGNAGGGNQLRQPYIKNLKIKYQLNNFKHVDHMHFFSCYIGNYPSLKLKKIKQICMILNSISYDF